MKNLIEEIEKALQDTEKLYRHTSEVYNGYLKSHYRGKIEAYMNILQSLKDYNLITAPKSIKLSEIVERLNCQVERYNEYINLYDDTYEEDDIRDYSLFIKNNKIDEIHILPMEEFKWLYTLWIAGTIIEDDLECDE